MSTVCFFGLDEFDVEFLEVVEADGGVVVAGVVPRLGAEVLLEVGRLEAVAVAGEEFVAHEAEVLAGDVLEVLAGSAGFRRAGRSCVAGLAGSYRVRRWSCDRRGGLRLSCCRR